MECNAHFTQHLLHLVYELLGLIKACFGHESMLKTY